MAAEDEIVITYSVKEILNRIEREQAGGFSRMEARFDEGYRRLEHQVDELTGRVTTLESRQAVDEAKSQGEQRVRTGNRDRLARIWAALAAVAAIALTIVTILR